MGKGTSVRILLPLAAADKPTTSERPTLAPKEPPGLVTNARPRVLLVDDEPSLVRSVARALARSGHEVAEAADGLQALERYQRVPRPDVVVMDVDMPGMNGRACFEQLRALDPSVKVVFISGYADLAVEQELRSVGARAFLRKPLDLDQLASTITMAMQDAAAAPAPG